jgi:DNA-binding XRE family transcriptional regulator
MNRDVHDVAAEKLTIQVGASLGEVEKKVIEATLCRYDGHRTLTAKILGIDRSTLHEKIKKYKLRRLNRDRWIEDIVGGNHDNSNPKNYVGLKRDKKQQQNALQSLLRQLRRDAGLTQKDIAKTLRKPQAFVSYYETGARRLDLLELCEVCEVLGISPVTFVWKFEKELLDPTLPTLST